jgi:peroxiredoxin
MDLYGAWGPRPNGGEGTIRSHFVVDEQGNLIDVQQPVTPQDSISGAMDKLRG